jgi:hypothetical protein
MEHTASSTLRLVLCMRRLLVKSGSGSRRAPIPPDLQRVRTYSCPTGSCRGQSHWSSYSRAANGPIHIFMRCLRMKTKHSVRSSLRLSTTRVSSDCPGGHPSFTQWGSRLFVICQTAACKSGSLQAILFLRKWNSNSQLAWMQVHTSKAYTGVFDHKLTHE